MKNLLLKLLNKPSVTRLKLLQLVLAWICTLTFYVAIYSYFVINAQFMRFSLLSTDVELSVILLIGYFFINYLFVSRYINHRILLVLDLTLALVIFLLICLNK